MPGAVIADEDIQVRPSVGCLCADGIFVKLDYFLVDERTYQVVIGSSESCPWCPTRCATTGLVHCSKRHLLDHLISDREQPRWKRKCKRLGSLKVDDEFELGRLHHR
jgi:hypothetical protein